MFINPPDTPPLLDERLSLSPEQVERAEGILSDLSGGLEGMAVVLSQGNEIIAYTGALSDKNVAELAELADRTWQAGRQYPARELVRFGGLVFTERDERLAFTLYSVHIEGAVTLTVGWSTGVSLTQLRAEVQDAAGQLKRVLVGEG